MLFRSLLDAFRDGDDVHARTAAQIFAVELKDVSFDQRRMAKVINFGLIYGMSSYGLAKNLGIDNQAAARFLRVEGIHLAAYAIDKAAVTNVRLGSLPGRGKGQAAKQTEC